MTAAPAPVALPHAPRYPIAVNGTWHATCHCHWMQPLATQPATQRTPAPKDAR